MTRPRYLLAATRDDGALERIEQRLRAVHPGAAIVLRARGVLAFVIGGPVLAGGNSGVIIGDVLPRDAAVQPSAALAEASLGSGQSRLIQDFWGGFVAIAVEPGRSRLAFLRAPLGDLGCYWVRLDGGLLAASDMGLLAAAGMPRPGLDAPALARQLGAEDLRREETCLAGVHELPGGSRLWIEGGRVRHERLWTPWFFAASEAQIDHAEEASALLRQEVMRCVAGRARPYEHLLLKLSGGLDSSIVAAALKASGRPWAALTLVTQDPAGDERGHAARVARFLKVPLFEGNRDPGRVAVTTSLAAALPRPTARSFAQESRRLARLAAQQAGAGAIFDGGGGDNVFCSLQSARPVADCLMSWRGLRRALRTCASMSELAQASLWTVARRAFEVRWRSSPDYRWALDTRFLSPSASDEAQGALAHPWLGAPPGALPGKAAHVALIAAAQSVAEGFDAEEDPPAYSPLISQPLVEACLRVPSWLWFDKGSNRAAARHAFEGLLPPETLWRRSKGAPDCFIAEVYERNRQQLEAMLLDGVLAGLGLVDVDALRAALDDEAPLRGHDFLRVMQLADTESWARAWG